MRIGVFDSGIGGLTVLKSLLDRFPNNEYIYYGDTKNVPYGNKSIEQLKEFSENIINFLLNKDVDIIVIACGTISSNLSNYLKNKYSIEIIDIITPTINYLNNSNYNKVGVIATTNTIKSNIFINNVYKDVKQVECPQFVPIIENKKYEDLDYYFDLYLSNLKDRDIVVLGCTHYPIIKERIQQYLPDSYILNMGDTINNITNNGNNSIKLYFTNLNDTIIGNIDSIIGDYNYSLEYRSTND